MNCYKSVFIASIALAFTCSSAMAGDYTQIKKKAEFAQALVDRKLTADWGWVMANADGSMIGDAEGQAISGTWKWKRKMFCRTLKVGSKDRGNDCQTVHVSGDNVIFIRDQGKGEQVHAKIN